ncbi:MAG: TetR/AcrR family transcriptional regulator [Myxococcaceae bacterium]
MSTKRARPAPTRKELKATTRARVLSSARVLFARRGFQAATIRAIAAEGGVSPGTVLAHFPDKLSLLVAALLDDLGAAQHQALATLPKRASVEKQLLHLARTFYTYYARSPDLARTFLKEMWFVPGEWGRALMADAAGFNRAVAELLAAARARGALRPDADCTLAATAFFSQYLSVLMVGLSAGDSFDPDEAVTSLGHLLRQQFDGLRAPTARSTRRR